MASPLEGPIRKTIGKAMRSVFYEAIIPRTEALEEMPPDHPPWEPWNPETITHEHKCRAFVDTYSDFHIASSLVQSGDVKIVVLVDSLAITPTLLDTITIRGRSYTILNVSSDPAEATWILQCRR
jgi:hypothetical protein